MYKKVAVLLAFAALFVLLVGCNEVEEALDRVEDRVENVVDKAEDTVEDAVKPKDAPATEQNATTALNQEQAESIALEYVQLTAEKVSRMRTEYEIDDGVPQYDVEFYDGTWEYEFEIHAETGKIISFDKDAGR